MSYLICISPATVWDDLGRGRSIAQGSNSYRLPALRLALQPRDLVAAPRSSSTTAVWPPLDGAVALRYRQRKPLSTYFLGGTAAPREQVLPGTALDGRWDFAALHHRLTHDPRVVTPASFVVVAEVRKALVHRGLDYYSELAAAASCRGQGPMS
jgi:hypothetical protein